MSIGKDLLPEFDQEMATTRRLLERVPSDRGEFKPHTKSFALGHLAQLVAGMPGWITMALQQDELDLASAPRYTFEPTEKLLRVFDSNVSGARAALTKARDSHLVHHRGQLTVYLRLLDVPIPSIYGPTADERGF